MQQVILLAGPTLTGKTKLAVRLARAAGGVVLPIDQLQMYKDLQAGVGLDLKRLSGVKTFGYQILSPWVKFRPTQYVRWLSVAVSRFRSEKLIVIEGGCTSYLQQLLRMKRADQHLRRIQIFALDAGTSERQRLEGIEKAGTKEIVLQIVEEVGELIEKGLLDESGAVLFRQCERLFIHPEHEHSGLAWALRISAAVYYPAYLAFEGKISTDSARSRMIRNVYRIQSYQSQRIRSMLQAERIFRSPYELHCLLSSGR